MKDNQKKVWFITGASRGMGINFVKEALNVGDLVVATARKVENLNKVFTDNPNLVKLELDITDNNSIRSAINTTIDTFGKIDILLNNAGNFYGGYFEEISPNQIRQQFETNVFGTLNITREVLPIMRKQKAGHIITLSSSAGLVGFEFNSAYSASKFAVEGWMEALSLEIKPFGIKTTIIEPGFFRSEFLTTASTIFGELEIEDYMNRSQTFKNFFNEQNGKQPGDPKKLAQAITEIAHMDTPPLHFVAGKDAIEAAEDKIEKMQREIKKYKEMSENLEFE